MKFIYAGVVALVAALASLLLTGRFRRYALARGVMDVPNARSSHQRPTPRGGGVAIVITVLLALAALGILHLVAWKFIGGLMSAGAVAAAVGYADDRKTVSVLTRLASHFAAAALAIALIGIAPVSSELHLTAAFGFLAPVLGAFYLVWMLNLTNFMDGIDGLASLEVITVCVGGVLCALLYKYRIGVPLLAQFGEMNSAMSAALFAPLLLAAATAGFMFWNWPPAKIFMGDAGSGFLGITLGILSLIAAVAAPQLLWSWLILMSVFIADATVTLISRIVRREKFYRAHRSHAYQHAALRWGHQRTTLAVGAINVCWLMPLALGVATTRLDAFVALAMAYIPLAALALLLRAGLPD